MRQNQITRWAWWGRTSTEDLQDPTLSLPRQLSNSHPALPPGAVIVAHFYDIESGAKTSPSAATATPTSSSTSPFHATAASRICWPRPNARTAASMG